MWLNYLVLAMRNLARNRIYAFINILGLAVSISACMLIYLYVQSEENFDRGWANYDRIYRINNTIYLNGMADPFALGSFGMAPSLQNTCPQVENAVRLMPVGKQTVRFNEKIFNEEELYFVDADFFKVFNYQFIAGDPLTALQEPGSIVLSAEMAAKYFGDSPAVGQILQFPRKTYTVRGVIRTQPESHIKVNALLSINSLEPQFTQVYMQDWFRVCAYTYVKLKPNHSATDFNTTLAQWYNQHIAPWIKQEGLQARVSYHLQPVADIHFSTEWQYDIPGASNRTYLYIFGVVGAFLLVIAAINYMNLAIATSTRRAKEVGIRKAAGASQLQLIIQFMGESLLLTLFSIVLALALTEVLLPFFNALTNKNFSLADFQSFSWGFITMLGLVLLFMAVAGGLYPAIVLARFQPAEVLRGLAAIGSNRTIIRKTLVIAQFTLSIAVLLGTLVVYGQMQYMKNKPLGFAKAQTVAVKFYGTDTTLVRKLPAFKQELLGYASIEKVSVSGHVPGNKTGRLLMNVEQANGQLAEKAINLAVVDADFFSTLGIPILQGRAFRQDFPADTATYIINEAAARTFGWANPLGKKLTTGVGNGAAPGQVIGVVKDYHYTSLHSDIEPLVFLLSQEPFGFVLLRLKNENITETMDYIATKWKAFDPHHPMEFFYLDDNFNKLYQKEEKLLAVFAYFAGLTIFISCLGLFGLASYTIVRRTKEIGIRKVMGAGEFQIVALLVKEFTILVGIAALIAFPPSYYLLNQWLQDFAYRIEPAPQHFIISGLLSLLVACIAVGSVAWRAARANPILALRYE